MSQDRSQNERSLVPAVTSGGGVEAFKTYISSQLVNPDLKGSVPSFIGSILYRKDSRLLIVGAVDDKLVTSDGDTPEDFNPENLISLRRRVARLPHLEGIVATQINLEDAVVGSQRVFRGLPSVEVQMPFEDPITKVPSKLLLPERDYLRVFTGEEGKIMHFTGGGSSQEMALLFERDFQMQRYGLMFFVHPSDSGVKLDSISGLHALVGRSNEQFLDLLAPKEQEYVERFEEALKKGKIQFGEEETQTQVLRAAVIAHAKLFTITGDKKYAQRLDDLLSGVGEKGLARFDLRRGISNEKRTKRAEIFIDRALGEDVPPDEIPGNLDVFYSSEGEKLAKALAGKLSYRYGGDEGLTTVLSFCRNANTEAELRDVATLIRRFKQSMPLLPMNSYYELGDRENSGQTRISSYGFNDSKYYYIRTIKPESMQGFFNDAIEKRREELETKKRQGE